ncbi:MAG: hypothetical protein ACRBCJ_13975 [Hyphomicrobiaceae bacterium]
MQTDDVFRAQLQNAISDIKDWAKTIASVADVLENEDTNYWRLVVKPHTFGACPIELMLSIVSGDAIYDIRIANEGYDDQPVDDLQMFVPILEAITLGQVRQRTWKSPTTNLPILVQTRVGSKARELWQTERVLSPETTSTIALDLETVLLHDRHFLPFHRNDAQYSTITGKR